MNTHTLRALALASAFVSIANAQNDSDSFTTNAPLNLEGPIAREHDHDHDHARPDSHAPIGVMQDHVHKKGEWMASYRYMRMEMNGNRDGVERVSTGQVTDPGGFGFPVSPTDMTMQAHMFGLMYAPSDAATLMLMVPFRDIQMSHVTRMGGHFTTKSSGVGDVTLAALVSVRDTATSHLHLNLGVNAPTGSIHEKDVTPASGGQNVQLPYPMQLGSGTWDLRPGLTWTGLEENWSWGAQALATLRLGRNNRDYSLGDRLDMTTWAAYRATSNLSFSGRLALARFKNIDGADGDLNPNMVPTANPNLRGGTQVNAFVGVNALVSGGNRLSLEVGLPVYQNLNGPQLETDLIATIGWQLSF